MIKKWLIKEIDQEKQKILSLELSILPITSTLLINRGIDTPQLAEGFLKISLVNLHDPFLMKGMEMAVTRIKKAIETKEEIMIHGDYDVDGICATALLEITLVHMGAKISHYIPDRVTEGYGINDNAVDAAIKKGIKLFISVDCGITAIKQTDGLNKAKIDVIITDHHLPPQNLPHAFSILNPLQKDCPYPYKDLSGTGVVFKLISALCGVDSDYIYEHLDLVCLGTVSDVVPLNGENRILVKVGLEQLSNTKKKGIQALISTAGLKGKEVTSHHVGYILGPRINAAGRLRSAQTPLELLLADDSSKAHMLAENLNNENYNRQRLEQRTLTEALAKLEREIDFKRDRVIVLQDQDWHLGVVGIVASRIADRFNRPTLILTTKDEIAKGSGRSIKNFHLVKALQECSHLLKNFGGHCYAAGLTLQKTHLEDFKKLINQVAINSIRQEDLVPTIEIDAQIEISSLTDRLFKEMSGLSPFGVGNPQPVFLTRNLQIKKQPQIIGRDTVKLWVTDGEKTCEAIGFRMADVMPIDNTEKKIDLVYTCSLYSHRGIESIQLQFKDIKPQPSLCPVYFS